MQLPNVRRILIWCDEEVRLHLFLDDVECHWNANPITFSEPRGNFGYAVPSRHSVNLRTRVIQVTRLIQFAF